MIETDAHNAKFKNIIFASVYPYYIKKVERKGRTKEELHQIIKWLTGFTDKKLNDLIEKKVTFETFFKGVFKIMLPFVFISHCKP